MATTTTTPNMGLVLPLPSVQLGPLWAVNLNTAFTDRIDLHDHSSGFGVKVTPSGLNISSDLAFQSQNATTLRSVAFDNQASVLATPLDVRNVYVKGGDLYYNNDSGVAVQITSGSGINTSSLVSNLYAQVAVNTNLAINPASSYVELRVDTSASRALSLPLASAVSPGRYYIIKDVTGQAATFPISVSAVGLNTIDGNAAGIARFIKANYGSLTLVSDGISRWDVIPDSHEVGGVAVLSAPVAGNALYAIGTTSAQWGALNLAGGANYVSGVLPSANLFAATTGLPGSVQLAGDLSGNGTTNTAPKVGSVTGDSLDNKVLVNADQLLWNKSSASLDIQQDLRTAVGAGALARIVAQSSTFSTGGDVDVCSGGSLTAGQLTGSLRLRIGGSAGSKLLHGAEVASGRRVLALMPLADVTAAKVPSGDGLVYVGDYQARPVLSPTGGCVLFSHGGNFGFLTSSAAGGNEFEFVGTTAATAGSVNKYINVIIGGVPLKMALFNV